MSSLSIPLSAECLGCFPVLVNSVAMNTGVHVSFQIMFFSGYMARSGIAGSQGSSIFSFLSHLYTVLHSGYTNLHFHEQYRRSPFSPFPLQHLLFMDFFFLMIAIWVKTLLVHPPSPTKRKDKHFYLLTKFCYEYIISILLMTQFFSCWFASVP